MTSADAGGPATFASFVEGPPNRLAATAARHAVEHPGRDANPLVVVAPAGLGKTHLLAAMSEAARRAVPPVTVESETVAGLAERMHGERGGMLPLHECSLLLLDQAEVLIERHDLIPLLQDLFDSRLPFGRQVVVATAVPPAEWGSEALARAVADGMIAEISPPDPGTRLAILRQRVAALPPGLPDEILTAVAALPFASVRELLAALQRVVAFQAVSPVPLDPEQARVLVGGEAALTPELPAPRDSSEPTELSTSAGPLAVADDEFGSFLSEVVAGVNQQLDRWRSQIGEAVLRFGGEGYRTQRLEALLDQEVLADPSEAIARFEREVTVLRALEAEASAMAPELAAAPPLRDPDRLAEAEALLAQARLRRDPLPAPAPQFQLERFGVGPGNRLAVQAARVVIAEPGRKYNPLVVIGASGTGKTHLVHAIGNALTEQEIGPVACLGAAGFATEAEVAQSPAGRAEWRARYQYAGALLLDDVHLLAGRAGAQEELLQLLMRYLEDGRQVVVASVEPLAALRDIEPRLLTRLEAGVTVDLPRPDREVRLLVVKQLLSATAAEGDAALADWLAARPADSVRAVQGAVRRVLSAAEAQAVAPSPALAREVLERSEPVRQVAGRSGAHRTPGMPGPPPSAVRSSEKMVQEWPRLAERLLEEFE